MQQTEQTVYQDASRPVDERVQDLLAQMTLAEKIGQMTQLKRTASRRKKSPSTLLAQY